MDRSNGVDSLVVLAIFIVFAVYGYIFLAIKFGGS